MTCGWCELPTPVVWARDKGETRNRDLLQYFDDRHVWQINGDDSPPRLESYSTKVPAN